MADDNEERPPRPKKKTEVFARWALIYAILLLVTPVVHDITFGAGGVAAAGLLGVLTALFSVLAGIAIARIRSQPDVLNGYYDLFVGAACIATLWLMLFWKPLFG